MSNYSDIQSALNHLGTIQDLLEGVSDNLPDGDDCPDLVEEREKTQRWRDYSEELKEEIRRLITENEGLAAELVGLRNEFSRMNTEASKRDKELKEERKELQTKLADFKAKFHRMSKLVNE